MVWVVGELLVDQSRDVEKNEGSKPHFVLNTNEPTNHQINERPAQSLQPAYLSAFGFPTAAQVFSTAPSIREHASATLIGAYSIGTTVALWTTREIHNVGTETINTMELGRGMKAGFKAPIYGAGDVLFDAGIASQFKNEQMKRLFRPNAPETLALSAAGMIPDLRFRTAALSGAWLLGRVYDYVLAPSSNVADH
jgi:hypothetical protein